MSIKKIKNKNRSGINNPFFGKHHTQETINILRNSRLGKPCSEETKLKISIANTGKKRPISTGKKISASKLGKKRNAFSDTWKRNIGLGHKGQIPWIKGKKHTEEALEKMRVASIGNKYNVGRIHSVETRRKLSEAGRGRPKSEKWKEMQRQRRKYQVFPIKDTKPERIMQKALILNGIKFTKHIPFKVGKTYHQVDLFIQPNICVEIDGDHWHANPIKYLPEDIISKDKKAKDVWSRDSIINTSLKNIGYEVIRFWESDIRTDVQQCIMKIMEIKT
jgi:DNA mismatch endonuclease (patch repair protein)